MLFNIMQVILFRHLIGLNCRLHMAMDIISQLSDVLIYPSVMGNNIIIAIRQVLPVAPDHILQVSDVLIYPAIIVNNIIHTIRKALNDIRQTRYVQRTSYIIDPLCKVWYQIYKSRILW